MIRFSALMSPDSMGNISFSAFYGAGPSRAVRTAQGPFHNTHSSSLPAAVCNPTPGETSLRTPGSHSQSKGDVNTETQEPPLSQVYLGADPAQTCCLLLPPCPTLDVGRCLPGSAHMEHVNLGEPAVDELFREVIPLHQEHVDLRGRAECWSSARGRDPKPQWGFILWLLPAHVIPMTPSSTKGRS